MLVLMLALGLVLVLVRLLVRLPGWCCSPVCRRWSGSSLEMGDVREESRLRSKEWPRMFDENYGGRRRGLSVSQRRGYKGADLVRVIIGRPCLSPPPVKEERERQDCENGERFDDGGRRRENMWLRF